MKSTQNCQEVILTKYAGSQVMWASSLRSCRIHNTAVAQPWSDNEECVMLEWAGGSIHHHKTSRIEESSHKRRLLAPKTIPLLTEQQELWGEAVLRFNWAELF